MGPLTWRIRLLRRAASCRSRIARQNASRRRAAMASLSAPLVMVNTIAFARETLRSVAVTAALHLTRTLRQAGDGQSHGDGDSDSDSDT